MISDIELSIPQSLTPDSSIDDTQSEEPSTPKANDALSIVNPDSLKEPTSFLSSKWCQRCGTLETPRWRFGPAGSATLCNACGLKWKAQGKPSEGYSSDVFPPPYKVEVKKRKSGTKKQTPSKKQKTSNRVLCDNRNKETNVRESPSEKKETNVSKPPSQEKQTTVEKSAPVVEKEVSAVVDEENKENAARCCEHCQTLDTPLWRRGPSGPKSLCNACGLKWAKTAPSSPVVKSAPSTSKPKPVTTKKKSRLDLLFNRKEFVKQGLYYDATRVISTCSKFSFDLPMHQGEFLISKEKEFELPPFIHQERELGKVKAASEHRVPFFTRIRSNIYVERKPQMNIKDPLVCNCKRPPPEKMGCGDDCINRMMFYECDPKHCPCGEQCSNQRFQRKEKDRKKALQVYHTEQRGWGLRTLTDIKKGEYVIEYRGEIISQKECEERMCTTYVNEKNFYFLDYHNGEVIDATAKGTEARFINHSCDPNCHIEKWSCRGESNFGVFASKDIKANSELFYDYNFSTFNGSVEGHQMCHCGSENCRGLIGRKVRAK